MKLPLLPWWLILEAAMICAAFAGMYAAFDMPVWITANAGTCALLLLALALYWRAITRPVSGKAPAEPVATPAASAER